MGINIVTVNALVVRLQQKLKRVNKYWFQKNILELISTRYVAIDVNIMSTKGRFIVMYSVI